MFQSSFPHSLAWLHLNLSSVALHFPEFLPLFLFFLLFHFFFFLLFISFSSSSLFCSSLYPNYTIMMISSIFLDISLLFSCCCFSFLFFFSSISDPAFSFPILQFSSSSFFFTSSHSSSFLLFQYQPSFPHSLTLLYISLSSPCSSFSSENSSISTSSFFLLFFFSSSSLSPLFLHIPV